VGIYNTYYAPINNPLLNLCIDITLFNAGIKEFEVLGIGVLPAVVSKRGVNGGNHYVGALSSRRERAIPIVVESQGLSR
jgi:hypothetical protein